MNGWSSNKKSHVYSKLPKSPAIGYIKPILNKVAVSIEFDDDDFFPNYEDNSTSANLYVNLPESDLAIPHGGCATLDCGISIEAPSGYRMCVSSNIVGLFFNIIDSKRIKLHSINFGEKILLSHKQKIGKIWIEPVYYFDWTKKG